MTFIAQYVGITTLAFVLMLALLLVVGLFAARQTAHDGEPMPEEQRRFLALYLVAVALPLAYLAIQLFSVQFPDTQLVNRSTPTLPDSGRPPNGEPIIVQIIPDPLNVAMGEVDLQIFGYNFKATATPGTTGTTTGGGATTGTGATSTGSTSTGATSGTGATAGGAGTSAGGATGGSAAGTATGTQAGGGAAGTGRGGASGGTGTGSSTTTPSTTTVAPLPTVTFNGSQRTLKFSSEQLLVLTLTNADTASAGKYEVVVTAPNGKAAKAAIDIRDQKGELTALWWRRPITRETQLILLAIVAGALGSYIHAIRSLTAYIGNQQAVASWFWFYVTRPFVGMALAIVFYAAIRGGFVAGSAADAKSVNPFGVFAVAALVGMFADKAGQKLADIFDTLFKSTTTSANPLTNLAFTTQSLPPATHAQPYTATLAARGGKPPYVFGLSNPPTWLTVDPSTGKLSGTPPNADANFKLTATVSDQTTAVTTATLPLPIA